MFLLVKTARAAGLLLPGLPVTRISAPHSVAGRSQA